MTQEKKGRGGAISDGGGKRHRLSALQGQKTPTEGKGVLTSFFKKRGEARERKEKEALRHSGGKKNVHSWEVVIRGPSTRKKKRCTSMKKGGEGKRDRECRRKKFPAQKKKELGGGDHL